MTDYTQEQIKDMAVFLTAHPEMVPAELKAQPVETPVAAPATQNIASITKGTQDEITKLKEELLNERKATIYATTQAIQSAIKEKEIEIAENSARELEWNKAVQELYSVMSKTTADKLIADKPTLPVLKSVIEVVKGSGAARVGVVAGIEMRSTVQVRDRMQALGIPSIEFTSGGN